MNCEVCGKEDGTSVCSSILGAVALRYCGECLHRGAEPLHMWLATIWINGPDGTHEDYTNNAVSFKDGEYIGWDQIQASYDPKDFEDLAY